MARKEREMIKYNLEANGNSEIIGIHDAVTLQPLATIKPVNWELANLFEAAPDMYAALKDLPRPKSILEEAAYTGGDVPKKWMNELGQYINGYNQAIKDCELKFAKALAKAEGKK